jgi:hypothetical protein
MTAFTVNGGATTDWDSLSGGSVNATLDTYAISNGTTLRINTDSYWCAGHSTAFGSLDTVTYSGVGGRILVDPTAIRVLAYTGGGGTVPAIGASITQGGVTGVLLGVWSGWQAEPTAVGAAMPATGYIKFKSVTGGAFAAGALTGITATSSEASRQGWIEIRGADTATITVPRIGKFETVGAWFELGTTNGARNQVIPCPTTATVAGVFPAVWIETSAGSGVYERFVGAGSIVAASTIPTDERGKIVWQTTGGIRIGFDGTNNVGFLPPTGCKVRIPAAIFTCCTRTAGGSGIRVLPSATLTTRQEFIVTSAGDIVLDGCVMQWYCNFLQAFRADVTNSAISDSLILQEIASPINVSNVIVAPTQAQLNFALNMVSCFGGGNVQNTNFARFSLAASGAYVNTCNYNKGVIFTNVKTQTLLNRGNATTGTWTATQNVDCDWGSCKDIGGRALHVGIQRPNFTNASYADNFSGTTGTGNPHYAFEFTTGGVDILVDGIDFMSLTNVHPYSGLVSFSACYNWKVRNFGNTTTDLNLGSANAAGVIVNGAGNNDTGLIQRIYTVNTRTGPWAFVNSDNNITIETVAGDYADTSVIAALNTIAKGVRLTGATTGQTSVYGTHWKDSFTSATVGKIEILCNEPTTSSAAQCSITSGSPQFNSVGQISLTVIGQQVTWEMPYFAVGHTALANLAPTLTGTNTGNLTYEFQYDKGVGYNGAWLTLNAANLTGAGAITPSIGVKLKVRATCATANAGNLLTNIAIPTTTTATDQDQQYPLDTVSVSVTAKDQNTGDPIENARVRITTNTGGFLVLEGLTNASGVLTGTTQYVGYAITGTVRRASAGFGTVYKPSAISGTVSSSGFDTTTLLISDE